jgi:hypothetical protein
VRPIGETDRLGRSSTLVVLSRTVRVSRWVLAPEAVKKRACRNVSRDKKECKRSGSLCVERPKAEGRKALLYDASRRALLTAVSIGSSFRKWDGQALSRAPPLAPPERPTLTSYAALAGMQQVYGSPSSCGSPAVAVDAFRQASMAGQRHQLASVPLAPLRVLVR